MLAWPDLALASGASPPRASVTWSAAALIALCYYLSQSAWLAGLGFWTLYRPLVGGTLVGLVLGDPWSGARAGATINLAYLGFLATGGALPTDISLVGYLGTTLVLAGGLDERAALVISLPAGLLGYYIFQLRMRLDVAFVHWADRFAARGNARGVAWCNVVPPQALLLLLSGVPCLLGVYYGPVWLAEALAGVPRWLLDGLVLAGGMLLALGIAMNLHSRRWRVNGVYFLLGFLVVALTKAPVLACGFVALVAAVVHVRSRPQERVPEATHRGANAGGVGIVASAARRSLLRRRDLLASWLNWLFFSHANYNYERMHGTGFAHAMAPVLRRLYPRRGHLAEALQRHTVYYNAEPNLGALVNGAVVALEEARARGEQVSEKTIAATKTSLAGPISALGDTLLQGAVAPTLLSLGVGLAHEGSLMGPLLYVVLIAAVVWGLGWIVYLQGYREGGARVASLLRRARLRRVIVALEIVGSTLLGALAAAVVPMRVPLAVSVEEGFQHRRGGLGGQFAAQALALGLILTYLAGLWKGVSPRWLVIATLVLAPALHLLLG